MDPRRETNTHTHKWRDRQTARQTDRQQGILYGLLVCVCFAMKGFKRGGKKSSKKTVKTIRKGGPVKFAHVSQREEELMQKWRKEGKTMDDIQSLTGRSKDTIAKHTDHAQPLFTLRHQSANSTLAFYIYAAPSSDPMFLC